MAKQVKAVEVSPSAKALAPSGDAVYRTVLVPVGQKVEVEIHANGVVIATDSWTALAKAGHNAAVQVRYRVFDDCELDTFTPPAKPEVG